MNLIFRLMWVIIHALFRRRLDFFDTSAITFRVLPNDLDFNIHMTNSRYLSIMDLGRLDLLIRSGAMKVMLKNKWQGVIGSLNFRFRHPLQPFQAYTLKTRLLNVDEKWCYIEHRFESKGRLVAYGLVRAVFVSRSGSVPVATVLQALKSTITPLPLKDFVVLWNQMEEAIKQEVHSYPIESEETHG